jgi:hypothetical protein
MVKSSRSFSALSGATLATDASSTPGMRRNSSCNFSLGQLIAGLRQSCPGDQQLLDRGMAMFEALYRSLAHPAPRKMKAQSGTTARAGC